SPGTRGQARPRYNSPCPPPTRSVHVRTQGHRVGRRRGRLPPPPRPDPPAHRGRLPRLPRPRIRPRSHPLSRRPRRTRHRRLRRLWPRPLDAGPPHPRRLPPGRRTPPLLPPHRRQPHVGTRPHGRPPRHVQGRPRIDTPRRSPQDRGRGHRHVRGDG